MPPFIVLVLAAVTITVTVTAAPPAVSPTLGARPPADATVLFDGSSWEGWHQRDGAPSRWMVQSDGSVLVHEGDAITDRRFRDFQVHVEFICPDLPGRTGQARSNSGVYLHGRYEVQVLNSYGDAPLADGCGALYGIAPPLVNASAPPDRWQTYDIVFRAPRLGGNGAVIDPARITVTHNGLVVQNNVVVPRATRAALQGPIEADGPILLQDHGDPVRYRNVWIRELVEPDAALNARGHMRILIVTAVEAEARAVGRPAGAEVVVGGIGRTNAAAATTEALLRRGPFDAAFSIGVAGALPGGGLSIGEAVVATACVYVEEGMLGPDGFAPLSALGLSLGDFDGNVVPVDTCLLAALDGAGVALGPIATVATCSGTDAAAAEVVRRTGAVAEAMEGAAAVHAARRLGTPAIELRVVSNTTGDRDRQVWDLRGALDALGPVVERAVAALSRAAG